MKTEKYKIRAKLAKACWSFKEAPVDIEYFPAGVHTICCLIGDEAKEITAEISGESGAIA